MVNEIHYRLWYKFFPYLILLLARPAFAHSKDLIIWDEQPYLPPDEVIALQSAVNLLDSNHLKPAFKQIDVLKVEDVYYVFPNGLNDVYIWSEHHLKPVFQSPFEGQNFGSKKFVYRHEIYSYGGYGFWNFYADLTRFDRITNEWVLVPSRGEKPTVESTNFRYCFIRDSALYAYFQWSWPYRTDRNNPLKKDVMYSYDLNSNQWKLEGEGSLHFPRPLGEYNYESKNYILEFNKEGIGVMLNKQTLLFKYNIPFHEYSAYYSDLVAGHALTCRQIRNDSIFVYDTLRLQYIINLPEINQSIHTASEAFVIHGPWNRRLIGYCSLCLILVSGIIVFLRLRKSSFRSFPKPTSALPSSAYPQLQNYLNHSIVQSVLDECLQISAVASADILRNKRASIIKRINEDPSIPYRIDRVRSSHDSRIYDYHITNKVNG